jgi:NitT/TauT family transport system ATP-binding protein
MSGLIVRNLWMEYPGQTVLERVNLSLGAGEFCALVGPSGCGKTTFLRMLLSIEKPTRGEILLDGQPLPVEPSAGRGVVFQRYSVFPHLRVVENVMLGLEFSSAPFTGRLFGSSRRRAMEEADRLLEAVGLRAARDKYPAQLSGGMQQRLALAQALILKPRLLLLDEPFGALDPGTKSSMHRLLISLWRERDMGVVMVTHDLSEAFTLATRVVALDRVRTDTQAPEAFGSTVKFDIKVHRPMQPGDGLEDHPGVSSPGKPV